MTKLIKNITVIIFIILITAVSFISINKYLLKNEQKNHVPAKPKDEIINITISAIGDCTFSNDAKVKGGWNSFESYLKDDDYSYYFRGVHNILNNDDLTIANLEGTFTDNEEKAIKTFNFKSPKKYVNILIDGSVEIVNIANNHTHDFKLKGYQDTVDTLTAANIPYFGYTSYAVKEVKGIKIGFAGLNYYDERNYDNYQSEVTDAINYLKDQKVDLIIITFHWGIEATYKQTEKQEEVGRFAIDNGADLVLGHHPHRIQGIENYNDKYIVYSLSNFVFGGHRNPSDKDSFIYQETFTFVNNKLNQRKVNIVPVSISGESNLNNYQPVVLDGAEKNRVIEKINQHSVNFKWE